MRADDGGGDVGEDLVCDEDVGREGVELMAVGCGGVSMSREVEGEDLRARWGGSRWEGDIGNKGRDIEMEGRRLWEGRRGNGGGVGVVVVVGRGVVVEVGIVEIEVVIMVGVVERLPSLHGKRWE